MSLPPQHITKNIFHIYKDPLMTVDKNTLPVQVNIVDRYHVDILTRVVNHHQQAKEKIGCGISGFFVRRSLVIFNEKEEDVCCVYIRRMDDSEEDFSIFRPYKNISWKNKGGRFDSNSNRLI